MQRELFEKVFSDAHLVDIDLSLWDKSIALYVLAGHLGRVAGSQLPMFAVAFSRVRDWSIDFNHLSHDPPIDLGPDEHVQWLVDDFEIKQEGHGYRIELWGHPASPRMLIVCEDVVIWELSYDDLYRLFPNWSQPGTGFIRPGLEGFLGQGYIDRARGREYAEHRLRRTEKGRK